MKTVVVINTKGGVGKTTVSVNLASYFAASGFATAMMDYDPQGSTINWLNLRSPQQPKIHGASAAQPTTGLRSLRMHLPPTTQQLIVDAPAGANRLMQQDMLRNANHLLIPVGPSAIDIHATANFIKDLLIAGRIRAQHIEVAVVANRVRSSSPSYAPLERFLGSLGMPFLTTISDSDVYLKAAETGRGIFEMDEAVSARERQEFLPIVRWIENSHTAQIPQMPQPLQPAQPVQPVQHQPVAQAPQQARPSLPPLNPAPAFPPPAPKPGNVIQLPGFRFPGRWFK
jgi:chromosome partitioning protein